MAVLKIDWGKCLNRGEPWFPRIQSAVLHASTTEVLKNDKISTVTTDSGGFVAVRAETVHGINAKFEDTFLDI